MTCRAKLFPDKISGKAAKFGRFTKYEKKKSDKQLKSVWHFMFPSPVLKLMPSFYIVWGRDGWGSIHPLPTSLPHPSWTLRLRDVWGLNLIQLSPFAALFFFVRKQYINIIFILFFSDKLVMVLAILTGLFAALAVFLLVVLIVTRCKRTRQGKEFQEPLHM